MNRASLLAPAVAACCVLFVCSFGLAQDSGSDSPQLGPRRHIPVLGNVDEIGVATGFEYYGPLPGFDRQNRDIDVQISSIAVAAHMKRGWEFQLDGLAVRGHGFRTLPGPAPSQQLPSNALALGFGPRARWNFLQFSRFRSFIETEGDFLLFDRPWPARGTVNDFLLRAGGGIGVRVSRFYWIESSFRFAHISNGECVCNGNPTWQGSGLALSLRKNFVHESGSPSQSGEGPSGRTDENAWITGVEDYLPSPGLNRQNGKVQADMRQARISRAWHFPNHLEFQLGGMFQTTRTTAGFGPVLRWNFLERDRWRFFTDGGADFLASGSPAYIVPWPDMSFNFFLRGRAGAALQLHESYWLEASYGQAHVTSSFGGSAKLFPWSGRGASISLRHTFGGVRKF